MDPVDISTIVTAVSIPAVLYTLINLLKWLRVLAFPDVTDDRRQALNAVCTIVALILMAWGVLALFGQSIFGANQIIGGQPLQELSAGDLLLAAIAFGGLASVFFDFKKAIDRSDSARVPQLVAPVQPAAPPVPPHNG